MKHEKRGMKKERSHLTFSPWSEFRKNVKGLLGSWVNKKGNKAMNKEIMHDVVKEKKNNGKEVKVT